MFAMIVLMNTFFPRMPRSNRLLHAVRYDTVPSQRKHQGEVVAVQRTPEVQLVHALAITRERRGIMT